MSNCSKSERLLSSMYTELPQELYREVRPTPVPSPALICADSSVLELLGVSYQQLQSPQGVNICAGNTLVEGSSPIAMAYAGHQFGHFVPQLGDGRAILLGERKGNDEKIYDIHLKGSGPTPYSRNGDGRSPLGPALREYLISNAMHALGVASTRALCVVASGESVRRERLLEGATMIRIARSHIRIGTFEYLACRQQWEVLDELCAFVAHRLNIDTKQHENTAISILHYVVQAQAALVAQWMLLGFVHGVMNTDNMALSGETIDFGPCAFMDTYKPDTVFSSIDRKGRYAYTNQPLIARWNLTRLAECLIPLVHKDTKTALEQVQSIVDSFSHYYQSSFIAGMGEKLGITADTDGRIAVQGILSLMESNRLDYTSTMRSLISAVEENVLPAPLSTITQDIEKIQHWFQLWNTLIEKHLHESKKDRAILAMEMKLKNPLYIPRNHLVEEAIQAAYEGNLSPFLKLESILKNPHEEQQGAESYALPDPDNTSAYRTFCGT